MLAKLPLEKEQSLLIVQAAEKAFLVGVTEKSMTAIGELDPSLIPEAVGTEANGTFFTSMQEAWGKLREPPKKGGRIP